MENIVDWVSRKTLWLVLVPAALVLGATLAVPVYLYFYDSSWKISYEINGSIGDFFGGIMNPIIALLALIWLIKGVRLQQRELEETKRALQDSEKHQAKQVNISAITAIISVLNEDVARLKNVHDTWEALYSNCTQSIDSDVMSPIKAGYFQKMKECDEDITKKRVEIDMYAAKLRAILVAAP